MDKSDGSVCVPGVAGEGKGFNFDLCKRNELLLSRGVKAPAPTKTGTTIAGIVFKVCMDLHGRRDHALLVTGRFADQPLPDRRKHVREKACRMGLCWEQTLVPQPDQLWRTRTVRKFIS